MKQNAIVKMTNFGINNKKDLCKITIDKFCGVWYNGNFGAGVRQRPGPFSHLEKKEKEGCPSFLTSPLPLLQCSRGKPSQKQAQNKGQTLLSGKQAPHL